MESLERIVAVNGVDLCVETFGKQGDPAVLLISGLGESMDWWEPDLCRRLADGGRYVVRYDHRDTGRSVSYPVGQPGYTGVDLAHDAVGVIDAVAGGRAHAVGVSMGGGIAQVIAVEHPDRVATLTLISTSPAFGVDTGLPPVAERLHEVFANPPPDPDWTDQDAVMEYLVEGERPYAGPTSFDEGAVRAVARRVVNRTTNIEASLKNHAAMADGGVDPSWRLSSLTAPTLVIHGTEDPLFPPGHGRALVGAIDGAELLLLDGVGHQVPPRSTWDVVVPALLRHTA